MRVFYYHYLSTSPANNPSKYICSNYCGGCDTPKVVIHFIFGYNTNNTRKEGGHNGISAHAP